MSGLFIPFIIFTANYNNNMGIFNFFKKKENRQEEVYAPVQQNETSVKNVMEEAEEVEVMVDTLPEQPSEPVEEKKINNEYEKIKIYNDYIVYSIALQLKGDYAPISAFEKENGEVEGFAYMVNDATYMFSMEDAIGRMEKKFESELKEGKIRSYMILYHSKFNDNGNHEVATQEGEFKSITLSYHCKGFDKAKTALPYVFENQSITYKGFSEFSQEENNEIMNNQLVEGKEYFTNIEEIKIPESSNEAGIKIKKSNVHTLASTWGGVFGFENFQNQKEFSEYLIHTMSLFRMEDPAYDQDKLKYTEFKDVKFKPVLSDDFTTMYPEVKTDFSLDFETKEINEWENVNNNEAVIGGSARDTFGIWFFATDYVENRNRYLTQTNLNVNISGIIFVLDLHESFELPDGTMTGEDFTAYKPSQDLPNYGCFDFVGKIIDFRETEVLADGSAKGYILKLKLITNSEMEDFFTIDAFVSKGNMRFETLTKGMQVAGALQLQGKMAD